MDWRKTDEARRGDYNLRVQKRGKSMYVYSLYPVDGGKVVAGGWRPNLKQAREAAVEKADMLTSRRIDSERRNPVCEKCGVDGRGGAHCPGSESGEHIWYVPGIPNMGKE